MLQAFAARVLASKEAVTLSRADLQKQGYDVETLVAMMHEYCQLPISQRGFIVTVDAAEIQICRKANTPAPKVRPIAAAQTATGISAPVAAKIPPQSLARITTPRKSITIAPRAPTHHASRRKD